MSKKISKNNTEDFGEILTIIEKARENTFRAVNRELISMYWDIGKYISEKVKINGWGKSVVSDFADYVQNQYVGIKGFSSQNIWRMKQFYETYSEDEKLSALLREISWTNNLMIMSRRRAQKHGILSVVICEK